MERQKKVKATEEDGREGGVKTALVDKGGIIATGRPFSDNTSDNETMQNMMQTIEPPSRKISWSRRQLDHSSQATQWAKAIAAKKKRPSTCY